MCVFAGFCEKSVGIGDAKENFRNPIDSDAIPVKFANCPRTKKQQHKIPSTYEKTTQTKKGVHAHRTARRDRHHRHSRGHVLPALAAAKRKAQRINCVNNLKQVGLAFRIWEGDNNDKYPMAVSTAKVAVPGHIVCQNQQSR